MTSVNYEAEAGQTEYQITFPYLSDSHLAVSINNTPTTEFTVTAADVVVLNAPPLVILAGDIIKIERQTPLTELLATFASTTTLRASELGRAFKQLLYGLQELGTVAAVSLGKILNGTTWDAENLPVSNVGDPTLPLDAATKAYVDALAATDGVLPFPNNTQIGLGIRIRGTGSGTPEYAIGPTNGAEVTLKIPDQTSGPNGYNGGWEMPKLGTEVVGAWQSNDTAKVPLEIDSSAGTPTFGEFAIADTTDILAPRGTFEVTAEGSVKNLTNLPNINQTFGAAFLSYGAGTPIDLKFDVPLGFAGGAGGPADMRDPAPYPTVASGYIRLKGFVTFLAPTRVYLRLSASTQGDQVVAEIPWRVRLKEVVL